jgi:hypothetical protein
VVWQCRRIHRKRILWSYIQSVTASERNSDIFKIVQLHVYYIFDTKLRLSWLTFIWASGAVAGYSQKILLVSVYIKRMFRLIYIYLYIYISVYLYDLLTPQRQRQQVPGRCNINSSSSVWEISLENKTLIRHSTSSVYPVVITHIG